MLATMLRDFRQTQGYLEALGANNQNDEPHFVTILPDPLQTIMDITAYKGITISSNPKSFDVNFSSRILAAKIFPLLNELTRKLEYASKLQAPGREHQRGRYHSLLDSPRMLIKTNWERNLKMAVSF